MNVLMVTVRADIGGGPKHIDTLIKAMQNDINIFIACPKDRPFYQRWKKDNKIHEIFDLPHRKLSIRKLIGLYLFVKKNEIEIIHSHGRGAGIYARLIKVFSSKLKVIHNPHGLHFEIYSNIKRHVFIAIEKILSGFTDKIINSSKGEQDKCLKYGLYVKEKSIVIYNGMEKLKEIKGYKEKLGIGQDKFIVVTVARFEYQKNMQLALEIARRLRNDREILFIWIGDGSEKDAIEAIVQKDNLNVILTGFKQNIHEYFSASDVYMSTSRWEGMPLSLIEALSVGLPVIATDVVGNNEVVVNKVNGVLFHETEPEKAVCALQALSEKEVLRKKYSNASKEVFENKFTTKRMVNETIAVYKNLLRPADYSN